MKTFKKLILLTLLSAIVGTALNCMGRQDFQEKLERRESRNLLNNNRNSRWNNSIELSSRNRRNILNQRRKISVHLTEDDLSQLTAIVNHANTHQNQFYESLKNFVDFLIQNKVVYTNNIYTINKSLILKHLIKYPFRVLKEIYMNASTNNVQPIKSFFEQNIYAKLIIRIAQNKYFPLTIPSYILFNLNNIETFFNNITNKIKVIKNTDKIIELDHIFRIKSNITDPTLILLLNFLEKELIRNTNNHNLKVVKNTINSLHNLIDALKPSSETLFEVFRNLELNIVGTEEIINQVNNLSTSGKLAHDWNNKLSLALIIPTLKENIKKLDLGNNYIKLITIPKNISTLTSLEELNLWNTSLIELPNEIGDLNNLTKLNLRGNKLVALPDGFANLTKLKELNLRTNRFQIFPIQIFPKNITNLTKLSNLTKLEVLNFWSNQLEILPSNIDYLVNLRKLVLTSNKLRKLPNTILNLEKLSFLHLAHNKLENLPDNIHKLSQLKYLNIANNKLTDLPKKLTACPNLRYLYISKNPFSDHDEIANRIKIAIINKKLLLEKYQGPGDSDPEILRALKLNEVKDRFNQVRAFKSLKILQLRRILNKNSVN